MHLSQTSNLITFLEVARARSISGAARLLGLTQPAITKQMQLLERDLGFSVLIRDNRGVHLTHEGRQIFDSLGSVFQNLNEVLDRVRANAHAAEGPLRIASLTEYGQATLMNYILEFRRQFPNITFEISYQQEAEIVAAILGDKIDLAVVTQNYSSQGLDSTHLVDERIVLVTRASNRLDIEEPAQLRRIHLVTYRAEDPLLKAFVKANFSNISLATLTIPLMVNSHRSMIDSLLADDLYAAMPWPSVAHYVETRLLRLASTKEFVGRLHLVRSPKQARKRRRIFEDFLMQKSQDSPDPKR